MHAPNSAWGRAGKMPPLPDGEYWVILQDLTTKKYFTGQIKQCETPPPAGVLRFRSKQAADWALAKMERQNGAR